MFLRDSVMISLVTLGLAVAQGRARILLLVLGVLVKAGQEAHFDFGDMGFGDIFNSFLVVQAPGKGEAEKLVDGT
jgi:hypothetical protein